MTLAEPSNKKCFFCIAHSCGGVSATMPATTAVAPEVVEAMVPVLQECFGNPSSSHAVGRKSRVLIEQSRRRVAKHLNCHPSCIYFTSGGTEADNLALRGAVRDLGCTRIITSEAEHSAVIKTAQSLERRAKWTSNTSQRYWRRGGIPS